MILKQAGLEEVKEDIEELENLMSELPGGGRRGGASGGG